MLLTDPQIGVAMLILFIGFILLGFPIAFTLMAMGIIFGWAGSLGPSVLDLLVQRTYSVMSNDVLISVPLFVFMGYIIERANILDRLFKSLLLASGFLPASLAVATMITCSLFGIASGVVGAVVTLMGLLALPPMLRAGYDVRLATGCIAAGGTLGILIPPSIMLILYGATAGVSVVKLYAAAFIPGFVLTGAYLIYIIGCGIIKPEWAPRLPPEERNVPVGKILWELLIGFVPLTLLTILVLAVILFGIATPTESAAMGVVGAVLLAVGYRSFTWTGLKESVYLTARTSAMVCWLFVGSALFSAVFGYLGGQTVVEDFVKSLGLNSVTFMLLAQAIIFVLGWPLEWTEIIVIFVPIFLPLLDDFGVDPIFFGVMIALNLQTSFLSPPVAMAPFYLKGVAPSWVKLEDIFAGVMPYIYIVIVTMVFMYIFPGMATWLPDYLYGVVDNSQPLILDRPPEGGFAEEEVMAPSLR
ncbi:TRAP transporter large permease [Plastoroseomonas arctica]|uniref:TRAP transporter large permease subunit n=1 Tax=Plastoroseomonas arctica TaxID=1509237 RepID=A0AAF1JXZ4_9PROT|nr:TRAP transporter large permease subunit [Plastoroseomonas arctica]MBR0656267.1 TRAP transporter large permease subunit [Plastoroseomonas arctica]